MTQAILSVGSNQNDPLSNIETAFEALKHRFNDVKMSSLYLTEPVGSVPQAAFMNAAIMLETDLNAAQLLEFLLNLEQAALRDRHNEIPKGPRNLDLDLIFFGEEISHNETLELPHPRFRDRRFVLEPLAEIVQDFIDPITQKSVAQLLADCSDPSWVKMLEGQSLAV